MTLPEPCIDTVLLEQSKPRNGWETFEASEYSETADLEYDSEKIEQVAELVVESNDDETEQNLLEQEAEAKKNQERITSLFQATRPNTSPGVEVSYRPQSARIPSTSRSQILRPTTSLSRVSVNTVSRKEGVLLTSIFSIDKISYDVELYDDRIEWTPVNPSKNKKYGSQKKQQDTSVASRGMVYIHEICSVRLKNIKSVKTGSVTTVGFAIFTARARQGNKLREENTLFLCFSRDICIQWATRIKADITARPERPKKLLVVSNGTFNARFIWDDIIDSRLQMACIKAKFKEINIPDSATDYVQKLLAEQAISRDAESYDGILVLGKLSFFSEILNAILEFKKEVLRSGTWRPSIPTLGFVPTVSTSYVGVGMHGCTDVESSIFHAIYGCTLSIPICSFYDKDENLLKYGIVASYGFSGGDTSYENNSKGFGVIQGGIKKGFAITKALVQRRVYQCEIEYKNSPQKYAPFDDREIFEDTEFGKSNDFYVDDENSEGDSNLYETVWPENEKWESLPRRNYLDVAVTSLPQDDIDTLSEGQLSAVLVRDTMSRKNLFMSMGSQVSLSSSVSKNKTVVQNETDIIHGSEFIVHTGTTLNDSNYLSKWSVDGCCLDADIQELHVKTDDCPLVIYGRAKGQFLSTPGPQNVLNLESAYEIVESEI